MSTMSPEESHEPGANPGGEPGANPGVEPGDNPGGDEELTLESATPESETERNETGQGETEHKETEHKGPLGRVRRWAAGPWSRERQIKYFLGTLPALVVPTIIMLFATQFITTTPEGGLTSLVLSNNTPTGGDFGAHVWGPDYLWDHVLTSGWYNGWSMDWYAGLPAYRFYMVVPAIMILIANIVLPYGVAMKVVSILGVVTIPASCWAFGRLANFRYPMPEIFAFAGLAFVLDESWAIYGGNLKSTMAGEFSFSIALSLAILGLGLFAYGLQTGRRKTTAAVVLSLAAVSHGLVLIFVAIALVAISVVWVLTTWRLGNADAGQRVRYVAFVGVLLFLLSAWWVLPFVGNHDYMTDMKYTPEPSGASFNSFWEMYFPLTPFLDIALTALALIGIYAGTVRRQLNIIAIGTTYLVLAALVAITSRWGLPMLGLLWNPRLLPFFYLCRNFLVAFGAYEVLSLLYNFSRGRLADARLSVGPATGFGALFNLTVLVILAFMFQITISGFSGTVADTNAEGEAINRYYMGPFEATDTNERALGSAWARYNFRGYEGGAKWEEYNDVINTMAEVGETYGCGRAQWENHEDNGAYGTTMALMLLPYWTDSCIGSMEGLFFEASGTTPYHFLSTAAMSEKSSNPVRGLRYTNNDASVGVEELQALGVRYTMLRSEAAKQQADEQPELTLVAYSGPWSIYVVEDADVVVPLAVQPVVVNERDGDRRERLLEIGTSWFQNQSEWSAMPATDGPDNWQRVDVEVDLQTQEFNDDGRKVKVDMVRPVEEIRIIEPPAVEVSNVDIRNQSLSFDVSEVGTPVEVKVSYFPNWRASGAEGPYRIGPNMMVVVPTDTHVELTYGRSGLDYLSVLLTIAGVALAIYGYRRGDIKMRPLMFGAYYERREAEREVTPASAHVTTSVDGSGDDGSEVGDELTDDESTGDESTEADRHAVPVTAAGSSPVGESLSVDVAATTPSDAANASFDDSLDPAGWSSDDNDAADGVDVDSEVDGDDVSSRVEHVR